MRSLEQTPGAFWPSADPDGHRRRRRSRGAACPTTAGCTPSSGRCASGATVEQVHEATGIDPWFLDQMLSARRAARRARGRADARRGPAAPGQAARLHRPADRRARAAPPSARSAALRHALGVRPVYKTVDTCAAEFAAQTPYHYSSYDEETEVAPSGQRQGAHPRQRPQPHRPGHRVRLRLRARVVRAARRRLRDRDGQLQPRDRLAPTTTPATGSTSSRSPSRTCSRSSRPSGGRGGRRELVGVIVQLGGQTPLRLAQELKDGGVPIVGTTPEAIHLAEDRGAFGEVLAAAGLPAPKHGIATSYDEAKADRRRRRLPGAGPPVLRARRTRHGDRLRRRDARRLHRARHAHRPGPPGARRPLPRRRDRDRRRRALRRHRALPRRRHGAHRGGRHPLRRLGLRAAADHARPRRPRAHPRVAPRPSPRASACAGCSTCSTPSRTTSSTSWRPTRAPSRTVPFVCKATAVPLAKAAARVMLGATIAELRAEGLLPGDRRRRDAAARRADRGQGGGAAVRPLPPAGPASTPCSARR